MKSIKKLNLFALAIVTITIIISCSKKDGDWEDNIELSQKEVNFDFGANSTTITTKGNSWWISNIRLNDEHINIEQVNTIEDSFDIIETEFSIFRRNATDVRIEVTENQSLEQREIIIGVQDGNYFDNIKIIQKGQ